MIVVNKEKDLRHVSNRGKPISIHRGNVSRMKIKYTHVALCRTLDGRYLLTVKD